MEKLCPHCQTPFIGKRKDTLYCSQSCRQMAYMERKTNVHANLSLGANVKENKPNAEPSIDVLEETAGTSTVNEHQKNEPSIDGLKLNFDLPKQEKERINYASSFVNALFELTNERDNISKLSYLYLEGIDGLSLWVSTRIKCLIECLLTFSEMKTVDLDDLKEVCNAFTMLTQSRYFIFLPQNYPYTSDIIELSQGLKKICRNADNNEPLKFRLQPKNKKNLIAIRWELSYYAPKKTFSQLNFKE
jgi:hypothetical protein